MIVREATVERVGRGFVWVSCDTKPECRQCRAGRGCAGYLFSAEDRQGKRLLRAAVHGHVLSPGDRVRIGVTAGALQRAAVALYLFPVLGLLAGAMLGSGFGGDGVTLAGAVCGLAAGFAPARRMDRRIRKTGGWRPSVICRLTADQSA
jgi:sigma-E factor negative regulatory protein RseC